MDVSNSKAVKHFLVSRKLEIAQQIVVHELTGTSIYLVKSRSGANQYYVLKVTPAKHADIASTEIKALRWLKKGMDGGLLPNAFVRFEDAGFYRDVTVTQMEAVFGPRLIEELEGTKSWRWWMSLVLQLVAAVDSLERCRILHNDFQEANILLQQTTKRSPLLYEQRGKRMLIPNAGFIVKVIDWQHAHHYVKKPAFTSQSVVGTCPREKRRMGWSKSFHEGADLNHILGILCESRYTPACLRKTFGQMTLPQKLSRREVESFGGHAVSPSSHCTANRFGVSPFRALCGRPWL